MINIQALYVDNHRMAIAISYLVVFVIGIYIARPAPSVDIVPGYKTSTKYQTDKITDPHYHRMYEKNLRKYLNSTISLLEIGLGCGTLNRPGASAYLWRNYFGPHAYIHFIENDKKCAEQWYKTDGKKLNVTMHYGSQDDVPFLNTIASEQSSFDVIIDDGGHSMKQQITSLTTLLPKVRSGGVYVIEDLQISYSNTTDNAYLAHSTLELIQTLFDDIQSAVPQRITQLGESLFSIEVTNRICFLNKK